MGTSSGRVCAVSLSILLLVALSSGAKVLDESWIDLSGISAWQPPAQGWETAADAVPDAENPKRLTPKPGSGVFWNGPAGKAKNLLSQQNFGDVEFHCEFKVPAKSNSGVKFEGLYEVQIADSFGVKEPKASECGGIYPRAELEPEYHHIDEGYPPLTNASRPPGAWQTLDVVFQPPRFDASGEKTANARFVKVLLNGQVVHKDREVLTPTGDAWHKKEVPTGPILLQGDHGPVAFRDMRARPWHAP
jgi:Domain of Unknown Function (DUF1080)